MAVAQEALIIEASVDDQVTPTLKKAEAEVKNFGKGARSGFEEADRSATKFGNTSDIVAGKIRNIFKASVALFAIDFSAKLFGFSGALDVVRKSSDALAESIRDFVTGESGLKGLTYFDRMKASAESAAAALKKVREEQAAGVYLIGGRSVGIGEIEAQGTADQVARALEAITKAQRDFEAQVKRSSGVGGLLRSLIGDTATTPSIANALQTQVREELTEIRREIDASAESGRRFNEMVAERVALRQRELQLMQDEQAQLDGLAENYTLFERQRAAAYRAAVDAANARRADLGFRPGFEGSLTISQSLLAAQQAARQSYLDSPEYQYQLRLARENSAGAGGTGGVFGDLLRGGFRKIADGLRLVRSELEQTARAASTFGAGVRSGVDELRELTSPSELGRGFAFNTFQSFRGFFNDLADGAKSFSDAVRDLARNFVASLADMIAQMLAFRAVAGIFGGFGLLPPFGAASGVAGGGGALGGALAGGGAGLPLLAPPGGGRGGNVNFTLNVASLDPRGAADVVLSAMPQIQRALTGAISAGTDRGFRVAVGSV